MTKICVVSSLFECLNAVFGSELFLKAKYEKSAFFLFYRDGNFLQFLFLEKMSISTNNGNMKLFVLLEV